MWAANGGLARSIPQSQFIGETPPGFHEKPRETPFAIALAPLAWSLPSGATHAAARLWSGIHGLACLNALSFAPLRP